MSFISEFQRARQERGPTKLGKLARRQARWGYAFIALWMVGFCLWYLIPMVASLVFSLFEFQLTAPEEGRFVGLGNWIKLFKDPLIWQSLGVTFKFALISLPIGMISAFLLAVLLNSEALIGKSVFRTLFYAPAMVPAVAGVLIWSGVFDPTTGWINRLIEWVFQVDAAGPNGIRWLADPVLVYIAYTMMGLWGIGNAILYNLASLQGVPTELYEAADIDGAGWLRKLVSITVPMVSPVIFFNLVLGVIGVLQFFITPYVLTGGSGFPNGQTNYYMIQFFKQAFGFLNMGYGSTIAWFMFLIALGITVLMFGTARYWVYYAGEGR
jgi:multiple sugar transport system permease protein